MGTNSKKSKPSKQLATKRGSARPPKPPKPPKPTRPRSSSSSSSTTQSSARSQVSLDFLSHPHMPLPTPESSSTTSENGSESSDDSSPRSPQPSTSRQTGTTPRRNPSNAGPSNARPSTRPGPLSSKTPTTDGKRARKQPKPKKRKNHVLRQIHYLQSNTNHLIPRAPFSRVVREVTTKLDAELHGLDLGSIRYTPDALHAIQTSAEAFIVQVLEDASLCTKHRGRVTLSFPDMILVRMLRRDASNPIHRID